MAEKFDDETSECSTVQSEGEFDDVIVEVEAVFSETVSHSSCNTQEDKPCPSLQYSYSDINEPIDSESNNDEKGSKARKFRNIALPNWLVKPHARKSSEAKHFHGFHVNKRKMLRTNSAPKKLVSGGVKLEHQQCKTIAEGIESENHPPRPKSPILPARHTAEEGKEKSKGHKWRRRASLPAQVGKRFIDGTKTDSTSTTHIPLTPEGQRKQVTPTNQMEKDVLKTLIFGMPTLGITKNKTTFEPEPVLVTVENTEENTNNVENTFLNHLKPDVIKPKLQLHRLEPPDLFYVPDLEEETETAGHLDRKVSVSAGELHTATKIDNEKLELELIKTLIGQDLRNYLEDKTFRADLCQKWCIDISQNIKSSVQNFKGDKYKIVSVVYIAAIRDKGIHAAVQCIWTPDQDSFATASYKNDTLYAMGTLMAVKYD